MKRVVIVRHAKAVPYGYDDDFTRDLADRGVNDAGLVGNELKLRGIKPDIMISSPANRAIQTARIFAEIIGFEKNNIVELDDIYDGVTTSHFVDMIRELPEKAETVFFFGHNPPFLYFADNLLQHFSGDMPTCSTVGVDFQVDSWEKVEPRSGLKAFHLVPAMFR